MVKESKKASNAAWDKENMVYQTVKVKKDVLARFKAAVAERGEKVNTVIKDYMIAYASGNVPGDNVPSPAPPVAAGSGLLSPAAAEIARAAADRARKDPAEWILEAVQEQSARDARAEELRRLLANKEKN